MGWPKGKPRKLKVVEPDVLDALARSDPKRIIALMLWKDRHRNPEMALQITQPDLKGFTDCMNYLEVEPDVVIFRPQGRPAQAAIPAMGKRRAVPAYPSEPPRPFVTVNLVQRGTMNSIKPIENNEDDAKKRDQGEELRRWRDKAPQIARQLLQDVGAGQFSTATIQEAAQALVALARRSHD